jgi:hypothetical protein
MKIETLNREDKIPQSCQKCNVDFQEVYCRYEDSEAKDDNSFNLIVLRCPRCMTVNAYWVDNAYTDFFLENQIDDPEPTGNQPLDKDRKSPFTKEVAKHYAKAVLIQDKKNKELNNLINTKSADLYKIGLSLTTINFARNEVNRYIQSDTSPTKVKILFASALYVKANSVSTDGGLWKHKGEGISERQLEEIFGVSRKTIRKWAEKFY